jgi:leucyl-tRNA synthetase
MADAGGREGTRSGTGEFGRYDPVAVEAKWRARWEEQARQQAAVLRAGGIDPSRRLPDPTRPKHYALTMFPYPSGDLHIGHWYAMVPADAHARLYRMRGYDVIFPMGFDAFGLPAENAAIRHGVHPRRWTMANIERMRRQLRSMGASFDWEREVVTCDPAYYRWNQWLFLKLYEHGLAYRKHAPVDFCPHCNTTVAREQVIGPERLCERCDTPVVRRELEQWFFRITAYAEELLRFDGLDWPERVVTMQRNWIGRSEGVQFTLQVQGHPDHCLEVFTTRIDTVYGVSFCVLAPEHPLVPLISTPDRRAEVEAYCAQAARRSEIERLSTERTRTGVFTGAYALHPLSGQPLPVWVADYVLATYGTGAIMAVPAHDERDFDFARAYGLPIPVVVVPAEAADQAPTDAPTAAYTADGVLVHSGPFSGLGSAVARERIADALEAQGVGQRRVHYRLRDWLISRQRYWGTPIPIVYCGRCGTVPVPEGELPVLLPEDAAFLPTGESPLRLHDAFRHTHCPRCGGPAERETDTMDTFVDSSWYQYRYLSPHDALRPFDPEAAAAWLPVDWYTGGVEHATMHLLYTRFFTKAMRDLGLTTWSEPMPHLFNQGVILGANSEKMSKSRGNVVNPDDLAARYGADAVRVYLMFLGPWEAGGPWNPQGIEGAARFLQRVYRLAQMAAPLPREAGPAAGGRALLRQVHRTVQRVGEDLDRFAFNTAIAALMTLVNEVFAAIEGGGAAAPGAVRQAVEMLVLLLAPLAPHLAEECWALLGGSGSVHAQPWPSFDPELAADDVLTLVVQVDGRVRDRVAVAPGASEEEQRAAALASPRVAAALGGRAPRRVVVVPGRLVNVVSTGG